MLRLVLVYLATQDMFCRDQHALWEQLQIQMPSVRHLEPMVIAKSVTAVTSSTQTADVRNSTLFAKRAI